MGSPSYTGRDNANQITLQDGIAPISDMYLWQPIGSAFYPPCVDGDFDMTVIGHEFRSVSAVPRGGGLRIAFARRVASPVNVDVDVFQQSRGRRVIDNLLVARFARRTRSFTWKGKPRAGKRLTRGRYFVRFRMPTGAGRRDVRRVTLARSARRFLSRPPFYGRSSCGLVTSYKLSGAVFGGRPGRRLGIAFRLSRRSTVRVTVTRGSRTVRSFKARRYAGERTHRLSLRTKGLPRGDYRVTLRAGTAKQVLVARRL